MDTAFVPRIKRPVQTDRALFYEINPEKRLAMSA